MLTDKEYLEHSGQNCPACHQSGNVDVTDDSLECEGSNATQGCSCSCGYEWTDIYTLVGYDNLVKS